MKFIPLYHRKIADSEDTEVMSDGDLSNHFLGLHQKQLHAECIQL